MFDPVAYFDNLTNTLKRTKANYMFRKVDGLSDFAGIIKKRKRSSKFIGVDISENGSTVKGGGAGYFDMRPTTVFICAACAYDDMAKKETLLAEFKAIRRAFLSKLIKDKSEGSLDSLDLSRTPYYEIPSQFADGLVGIYFIINNQQPENLAYDESEWE